MIVPLVVFLCLSIGIAVKERVPFIPERVILVDKVGSNYLVRGNLPIIDGEFVIDNLKKEIARVSGIPQPKQKLIVYSLINHYTDTEGKSALIEQQFFNDHPNQGNLYFYPIFGFFISPGSLPEFIMRFAATYYESVSYDKLQSFLDLLRKQLQVGSNKVIYFHCTHGLDRTGFVAGAYKMKYKNQTLNSVMRQNVKIAQRDLKWTVVNGINWFCQQLKSSNPAMVCRMSEDIDPPTKQLEYQL